MAGMANFGCVHWMIQSLGPCGASALFGDPHRRSLLNSRLSTCFFSQGQESERYRNRLVRRPLLLILS
jgi:hypothetical protein